MKKTCSMCGKAKAEAKFVKASRGGRRERYCKECHARRSRAYYARNKRRCSEHIRQRRKTSLEFRLQDCLSTPIYRQFKGKVKCGNIWELLGYGFKELTEHLEGRFVEGMTWANYGQWEIDHIIPRSFFRPKSPDDVEFRMCWRLENLRPLWRKQNGHRKKKLKMAG